jgi:hypothetical protein
MATKHLLDTVGDTDVFKNGQQVKTYNPVDIVGNSSQYSLRAPTNSSIAKLTAARASYQRALYGDNDKPITRKDLATLNNSTTTAIGEARRNDEHSEAAEIGKIRDKVNMAGDLMDIFGVNEGNEYLQYAEAISPHAIIDDKGFVFPESGKVAIRKSDVPDVVNALQNNTNMVDLESGVRNKLITDFKDNQKRVYELTYNRGKPIPDTNKNYLRRTGTEAALIDLYRRAYNNGIVDKDGNLIKGK